MSNNCSAIAGRFRLDETHQYVRGWIYNRNCPNKSQWVEILVGDQVVASIEASLPRGDLRRLNTGYTRYGFEFLFPDWPHDANETELVSVRDRDSGTALQGNTARIRKRSIASQHLPECGLGELKHYEVSKETQLISIDSNTWSGDPAYKPQLLGLDLEWENRKANMQQTANGQWQYQKTIRDFCFPNAIVIMPYGIVIVDGQVVRPSLMLLNESLVNPVFSVNNGSPRRELAPQKGGSSVESLLRRQFDLRIVEASVEYIDKPALLMSTPGYQGYFHWHVDVLPLITRLGSSCHEDVRTILCVNGAVTWQRDSLQLVRNHFPQHDYRLYGELKVLRVRELLYSSGLAGRGAFLSSDLVSFYDQLVAQCPKNTVPDGIGWRLYLSRKAHVRRTMRNETEIEALVDSCGFTVIDPADYSYQQQIDIFRQAQIIVSPHGAGLTNLLFCPDGIKVIELFGDAYLNRGLQRLANLKKAQYGYIVGKSTRREGTAPGRQGFDYKIPPQELKALIKVFDSR